MRLPSWSDWFFSLKAYFAAVLALYIGLAMGLPRPYWAMTTVYVAMHPLAGATTSKAVFRFSGTLIGAIAALAIVPNFVGSPELMTLALATWTGLCLFISLQDRTPRSYIFMLAGYSAAIIGLPSVQDPHVIWDTASWRVEEIFLGIGCASVVSMLVFPRPVSSAVGSLIGRWLDNAGTWCRDVLNGRQADDETFASRRQLAADAVEIDMLATHLGYDRSVGPTLVRQIQALRTRMLVLMPLLSSLGDRLASEAGEDATLRSLREEIIAWVEAGPDLPQAATDRLLMKIRAAAAAPRDGGWSDVMRIGLTERYRDLVELGADLRMLRSQIMTGNIRSSQKMRFNPERGVANARHRDPLMALWSAIATASAVGLICFFWIATGWPEGASAAMMAAVGCSIFATLDNPAPMILTFSRLTLMAAVIALFYTGFILPRVENFEILVLAIAPPLLIFGALAARPATFLVGLAGAANLPSLMALQNNLPPDFVSSLNSSMATFLGLLTAAIVTQIGRSVGAGWGTQRLLRKVWLATAIAAEQRRPIDRARFLGLMLDRIGMLAPRLSSVAQARDLARIDPMREIRVGLNVIDICRARGRLQRGARQAIDAVLVHIAAYYRACARQRRQLDPPKDLLAALDQALPYVSAITSEETRQDVLMGLSGIRCAFFRDKSYEPPVLDSLVA
ncbi:Uncharacterized membrane protein YccC [Arboricoccus pini]|uniref:Uncharacterized membrane protein YccC n=1 Tax=Arboricoccus pini TaxID=1963835 RepID=A0A212R0T0_9PROT|nr:FUSC family protein [Arboricoccus pini]SNB65597.1 Uncharacterized membrane protein YccC [Arboricoccus pini]